MTQGRVPNAGARVLLVALLATAEFGTVLLLAQAGDGSFSLTILTVMGNAREVLIASLCIIYVGVATTALAVVVGGACWYARARRRWSREER